MRIALKNPDGIKVSLFPQFGPEILSPLPVIHSISRKHISQHKNTIVKRQNYSTNIMKSYGKPKGDKAISHLPIAEADSGNDQYEKHQGVGDMP